MGYMRSRRVTNNTHGAPNFWKADELRRRNRSQGCEVDRVQVASEAKRFEHECASNEKACTRKGEESNGARKRKTRSHRPPPERVKKKKPAAPARGLSQMQPRVTAQSPPGHAEHTPNGTAFWLFLSFSEVTQKVRRALVQSVALSATLCKFAHAPLVPANFHICCPPAGLGVRLFP